MISSNRQCHLRKIQGLSFYCRHNIFSEFGSSPINHSRVKLSPRPHELLRDILEKTHLPQTTQLEIYITSYKELQRVTWKYLSDNYYCSLIYVMVDGHPNYHWSQWHMRSKYILGLDGLFHQTIHLLMKCNTMFNPSANHFGRLTKNKKQIYHPYLK